MASRAIVITNGLLDTFYAKTCHGLLRGTSRYNIQAVIDYKHAGKDSGEVVFGKKNNIPVISSVQEFVKKSRLKAHYCIVGVAVEGGLLPDSFRGSLFEAIRQRMSIVNGLHTYLSADDGFITLAKQYNVKLIDIRKPKPISDLAFWSGEILKLKTPRVAVLGIDCAVGKRTTARWLVQKMNKSGIPTEMIYTGQTGWLQGYKYGFIFDSTLNDFVSGELEHALLQCVSQENPKLMIIEGQSSLRNPTGPGGYEFIISGGAQYVILQHKPSRKYYDNNLDWKLPIPHVQSEIDLINTLGAEVLAVTVNPEGSKNIEKVIKSLRDEVNVPVYQSSPRHLQPVADKIKSLVI